MLQLPFGSRQCLNTQSSMMRIRQRLSPALKGSGFRLRGEDFDFRIEALRFVESSMSDSKIKASSYTPQKIQILQPLRRGLP